MNKFVGIGRLSADPIGKTTSSGVEYSRFTLAIQRRQSAGTESVVDFVPCIAWRNNASFINKFLDKGALVAVEGEFQSSRSVANGQTYVNYTIHVDNIESLENRQTAEMRRQKRDQSDGKTFDIPNINSNSEQTLPHKQSNNSVNETVLDDWKELFDGVDEL
ncbi:single-stranded DNA-binding protein [Mycoplasma phocoenae]|uniref:Single-stranded DNA-binding protein n=1 Tax=Mycoplasma phocoenae TaxID=754517 RepID=A0A858U462_9MOLU|nr:single-stranded DNA-binding protein [Mycoplasma phocoenae]QJG66811.1 single-stranded DNA-binding protein [Mycoplasma phocoenae]